MLIFDFMHTHTYTNYNTGQFSMIIFYFPSKTGWYNSLMEIPSWGVEEDFRSVN